MLSEKPWRMDAVTQLVVGAAGCLLLSSLWMTVGADQKPLPSGALRSLGATATFQGAVVVMLWFFVRQHSLSLREAFGFDLNPGMAAALGVGVGLLFVPIEIGVQQGIQLLSQWLHLHLPEQNAVTMVKLANNLPDRVVLGFMTMVAAPIAEEGLFRGVFYPALRRVISPGMAMLLTSLVFAFIHGNVAIFIPLVLLAIGLTKLYEKTGNLLACILCHATFNAINFVALLFVNEPTTPGP